METKALPAIIGGGTVGAIARWAVAEVWQTGWFPWATLVVNVAGCLVLGYVGRLLLSAADTRRVLLLGIGTGFCGGLTTLSGFAVESATLLDDGRLGRAAIYVALSIALGGLAVALGWRSAHAAL